MFIPPKNNSGEASARSNSGTKCGSCSMSLSPGASHQDAQSCIEALRAALERALVCDACGFDIGEHCPGCAAKKAVLNKAAGVGMHLFAKAQERLQGKRGQRDS